jgi:hypothetical protein
VRRFIRSLPGKVVSQLFVLSLLVPSLSLSLIGRAEAQLQQLPQWAVTDFVVRGAPNSAFGAVAAEAVASELAKTQRYEVQPQESVKRALETLTLQTPVRDITSLTRLAQELRVGTIVTGEVAEWKVRNVNGGKQATVAMQVNAYDAASGLGVNGAAVQASSTVRAGDVPNDTLINEAIQIAASKAVSQIQTNTLPTGTVLNTFQDTALINQGARTGFKSGQDVIVTRGREQVAVARVTNEVDPDQATVKITRSWKGIQPGDKVRAVFVPPTVKGISNSPDVDASPSVTKPRARGNNSGFVSLLLVVALGAILLGGGNASSQSASSEVITEATMYPDPSGVPAVKVSWSPNLFSKGNTQRYAWQIWRNDVIDSPVLVVPGGQTSAYDTTTGRTNLAWFDFGGVVGGATCDNPGSPPGNTAAAVAGVTPGRAYVYQVSLVYRVNSLDLPDASTGGSGGNTGGTLGGSTGTNTTGGNTTGTNTTGTNTTGTNTTGTNTTGTNGGGGQDCFFSSGRDTARGLATPLARPQLQAPAEGAAVPPPSPGDPVNDNLTFTFQSAVTTDPITVEYIVEVSTSPSFTKSTTRVAGRKTTPSPGTISITADNNFLTAQGTIIWWRVGARNIADRPGPTKDPIGQRFVFGPGRSFTRPGPPPPPPAFE